MCHIDKHTCYAIILLRLSYSATYLKGRIPSLVLFLKFFVMKKSLPVESFKITEGPSKFDFMLSIFDGKVVQISCDLNVVASTVSPPGAGLNFRIYPKLEVIFQSLKPEDGSRNRWLGDIHFIDKNYENVRRKFYYDTKTRKGHIREISE